MIYKKKKLIQIVMALLLLWGLSDCAKATEKQLPPLVYESNVEYAFSFLHAMNSQDTQAIDALLDKDAILVYEENPDTIVLGKTSDADSFISYLLALNSRYEDICEEKNNLNSTMTSFLYSNKILEDIWGVVNDERTRYEFVVENQRITLIYVYANAQEQTYKEEYMQGGVGIEFSNAQDNSCLKITKVYPGTPAAVLKLQEGDLIYSLNGIAISNMSLLFDEAQYRMLGLVGVPLMMEVQRQGSEKREELSLTRMALADYIPLSDEEILNQLDDRMGEN